MSDTAIRQPRTENTAALWVTGVVLVAVASLIGWGLSTIGSTGGWPAYEQWSANLADPVNWLMWVIGDTTEPQFYKSALGGLGMLLGALVGWALLKRGSRAAGFPISYGTGLVGWILAAAWISLILANLAFQWTINETYAWQPTFVTFVSVPATVVLIYGGGWPKALTAAVLGALLTTPISLLVVDFVCLPLGLPVVVGNVTGMWGGALIAFVICRVLPWMRPQAPPAAEPATESEEELESAPPAAQTPAWLARRVLADFSEPPFYGNEWASAGLLLGVILEFALNPTSPVYGSGSLPGVLVAQVVAATVGVLVFRRQWRDKGWYPTFIPIVSIAPAIVLAYGSTPLVIAVAGVLGALTGPPLGAWIGSKMPSDFHPFIGFVMSMTICSAILVPLLKFVPGFGS